MKTVRLEIEGKVYEFFTESEHAHFNAVLSDGKEFHKTYTCKACDTTYQTDMFLKICPICGSKKLNISSTNCIIIAKPGEENKIFDLDKMSARELAEYLYTGWTIRKYASFAKR